jgi:pentatricopeptide repeat protein
MGLALIQNGKLEEAMLYFRNAAKFKPAYLDAQRNLQLAESIYAKISKAAAGMRHSMNFDYQDPEVDLKLMELMNKKIELDKAVSQLYKALSLQPGFTDLDHKPISIVLDIKQKYEAKLALFHKIIEYRPDSAAADYHIACVYSRRGQIDEALKWLNQAIRNGFNRWDLIGADSDLNGISRLKKLPDVN